MAGSDSTVTGHGRVPAGSGSGQPAGTGRATEFTVPVDGGTLAALDFGGRGTGVLLVHGSGHNAAVWTDVAALLAPHCHPVAVDLRGHGQSLPDSRDAEQYWRDLGAVVEALGWERPVLVGHSAGAYAVTAATVAGLVEPAALCLVDGFSLDDRATAAVRHTNWTSPDAADLLRSTFRYGWRADDAQRRAYVEQCVREAGAAGTERLNAGARPALVREVTQRSFVHRYGRWVRRPTVEEIMVTARPDQEASVYPSAELYEGVRCPLTMVLADNGLYTRRREDVQALVERRPGRRLVDVPSHHNVPMARPGPLATTVLDLLHEATR